MIEYENLAKFNKTFFKIFKKKLDKKLKEGKFILSSSVNSFEKNFSKFLGTKYCVGVGNGLNALNFSFRALKLPYNSEVIVASNVYFASILSIINYAYYIFELINIINVKIL